MSERNAVRPKLVLRSAAEAIDFYLDTLGAVQVSRYVAGDTVVFAELEVLGTAVTLKDADEHDPDPVALGAPGPILDVVVDDPDGVARRLLEGGAEVVFPVADQPYGARGGRVRDPFGVQWLLQTPVTMSSEEFASVVAGDAR